MSHNTVFPPSLSRERIASLFFQKYGESKPEILSIEALPLDNSSSILVTLTAASGEDRIGHFRYRIVFEADGKNDSADIVVKVKPHGTGIASMLEGLAAANGEALGSAYSKASHLTGFSYSHEKELFIDDSQSAENIFPEIWGIHRDEEAGLFYIMMEYLGEAELINSVMEPEKWTDTHIKKALAAAAQWHQHAYSILENKSIPHWPDELNPTNRASLIPLYQALWNNAAEKLPELLSEEDYAIILNKIKEADQLQTLFDQYPKTWIHNDMNPRNSCFVDEEGSRFVLYDWELFTVHLPLYDVVEFLSFVLDEDRYALRPEYFQYYIDCLKNAGGPDFSGANEKQLIQALHFDFCFLRIGMYLMAHCLSPYPFLPRVVKSAMNGIKQFS